MTIRNIPIAGTGVQDIDLLNIQRWTREVDGWMTRALLGEGSGASAFVGGFEAQYPGGMSFQVSDGCLITKYTSEDTLAYGSLPASSYGLRLVAINTVPTALAIPATGTAGLSVNTLIYATYSSVDGTPRILFYQDPSDPLHQRVFRGANNNGEPVDTTRTDTATISALIGTPAATGTQTTPATPSGSIPLYVVTTTYAQTVVIAGNVSVHPSAPFIAGLVVQHHKGTPGQAPKIDLTSEVQNTLPMANLLASDTVGQIAAVQSFAGNPNGHVAGNTTGGPGSFPPSMCWDYTDSQMWICVTSGTATTAVWFAVSPSQAGRLINVQQFEIAGTYTYTKTPGTNTIKVRLQGGGGGAAGAPATAASQASIGSNGGAGAYSEYQGPPPTGGSATLVIGAAGTSTVGGAGANGGTSALGGLAAGTMTAPGGAGGSTTGPSGATAFFSTGGAGGVAGAGANVVAAAGETPNGTCVVPGVGVIATPAYGRIAGLGNGGIGTTNPSSSAATAGGNGTCGGCIIEEYS